VLVIQEYQFQILLMDALSVVLLIKQLDELSQIQYPINLFANVLKAMYLVSIRINRLIASVNIHLFIAKNREIAFVILKYL